MRERRSGFAGLAVNGRIDSYWSLAECGGEISYLRRNSSGWSFAGMYFGLAKVCERGAVREDGSCSFRSIRLTKTSRDEFLVSAIWVSPYWVIHSPFSRIFLCFVRSISFKPVASIVVRQAVVVRGQEHGV